MILLLSFVLALVSCHESSYVDPTGSLIDLISPRETYESVDTNEEQITNETSESPITSDAVLTEEKKIETLTEKPENMSEKEWRDYVFSLDELTQYEYQDGYGFDYWLATRNEMEEIVNSGFVPIEFYNNPLHMSPITKEMYISPDELFADSYVEFGEMRFSGFLVMDRYGNAYPFRGRDSEMQKLLDECDFRKYTCFENQNIISVHPEHRIFSYTVICGNDNFKEFDYEDFSPSNEIPFDTLKNRMKDAVDLSEFEEVDFEEYEDYPSIGTELLMKSPGGYEFLVGVTVYANKYDGKIEYRVGGSVRYLYEGVLINLSIDTAEEFDDDVSGKLEDIASYIGDGSKFEKIFENVEKKYGNNK